MVDPDVDPLNAAPVEPMVGSVSVLLVRVCVFVVPTTAPVAPCAVVDAMCVSRPTTAADGMLLSVFDAPLMVLLINVWVALRVTVPAPTLPIGDHAVASYP